MRSILIESSERHLGSKLGNRRPILNVKTGEGGPVGWNELEFRVSRLGQARNAAPPSLPSRGDQSAAPGFPRAWAPRSSHSADEGDEWRLVTLRTTVSGVEIPYERVHGGARHEGTALGQSKSAGHPRAGHARSFRLRPSPSARDWRGRRYMRAAPGIWRRPDRPVQGRRAGLL